MSRVVVSLHGIRTRGVWQKALAPLLTQAGFIPYPLDYEYFSAVGFLRKGSREAKVEWLRKELEQIKARERVKRVSIIAHSFGTFMTAALIEKYHTIQFDKIILAGGIVRRDFDWEECFKREQVNFVRNDYGRLDIWPTMAQRWVAEMGSSGRDGFLPTHPTRLEQNPFLKYSHSDYFCETHFKEHWIPTLRRIVLHDSDRKALREILNRMVQDTAQGLKINETCLRANIFTENPSGNLSIQSGLHVNMNDPEEQAIELQPGDACTGNAFVKRRTEITRFVGGQWTGVGIVGGDARRAINPRLRWVVSTPIFDCEVYGPILGTMSLDCLDVEKEQSELEAMRAQLHGYAEQLAKVMKART